MNEYKNGLDDVLHISVWPEVPQLEIYTSRGQSKVFKGEDAIEFARWVHATIVSPILAKAPDVSEIPFPDQPIAKNLGELVTAKQLGMIRALARELRIDADEECNAVMNCRSDELNKRAASAFIQHLKEMQRPGEIPPIRRMP